MNLQGTAVGEATLTPRGAPRFSGSVQSTAPEGCAATGTRLRENSVKLPQSLGHKCREALATHRSTGV